MLNLFIQNDRFFAFSAKVFYSRGLNKYRRPRKSIRAKKGENFKRDLRTANYLSIRLSRRISFRSENYKNCPSKIKADFLKFLSYPNIRTPN